MGWKAGATALTSLRLYRAPAHGIDRVVGLGRLRRLDLDLTGTPRWTALAALRPDTVALSGRGLDDALLHAVTPSLFSRVAGLRLVTEIGEAPELAAGLVRLLDETHELIQLQLCGFTVSPVAAARLRGPLPANTDIQLVEPVPGGLLGIPGVRGTRPDQRGWGPLS